MKHLCVPIKTALEKQVQGIHLFSGKPLEVRKILLKALDEGKTFYSGCSNMDKDGRCAGHKL